MNHMSAEYYLSDDHKTSINSWKKNNPDKVKEIQKRSVEKRKQKDPYYFINKIFRERRRSALKREIPFEIEFDRIKDLVPEFCPILGIPLYQGSPNNWNSPSLDRIIPSVGYTVKNVHWISHRANMLKNDASFEEAKKLYEWLDRQRSL